MGYYPFIYISEYIFLLIIFSMAYILLERFVNLNKAYEELNLSLEQRVVERTAEILKAQAQVKQLEGIIPICMYCKKIRDDQESWHQLEKYISDHSDAQFSHSICPACYEKVKSDL
jgi:protein subunit release factor A